MNERGMVRIDVRAAKSLALWKAMFDAEVLKQTQQLGVGSSAPNAMALSHYRKAAAAALQTLLNEIHKENEPGTMTKSA